MEPGPAPLAKDGYGLRIVKGYIVKKIISLAGAAAMLAFLLPTAPAAAAGSTATGTVTIKWNVTYLLTLTLEGDYTNAGGNDSQAGPMAPLTVPGGGTCAGGGAAVSGGNTAALTLDYGAITPSAANPTVCVGLNAAEAEVSTNDGSGVTIKESLSTAPAQAGAAICGIALESNAPVAWAASGVSSSNYTAAKATDTTDTVAANWSGTTCAGLKYSGATVNAQSVPAASTAVFETSDDTTNPANFGEDFAVLLPANASATAGDQGVVTYTVTTN